MCRSLRIFSVGLCAAASLFLLAPRAAEAHAELPPGFADVLISDGIALPTAFTFTPDGRILVTEQSGALRVIVGGQLLPEPAMQLGSRICSNIERGLLGVVVHPQFEQNGFVYLYYTFKKLGTCDTQLPNYPVNRLSRFVMSGNTVDPDSEVVLIDNIPSVSGNHNAGDIHFGADGFLYVAVGNGGCDYMGDTGCGGDNDASRDENVLLGKILRITADGGIPANNPFQGAGTARCNVEGKTLPGLKCRETFAWGLRNPFKIAFDPNAPQTRFAINDVGQFAWEEINLGIPGADYGWNVREGPCANGSLTDCGPQPPGMVNPAYAYPHFSTQFPGCGAITGGAFVPNSEWPVEYHNAYLFADFNCGRIYMVSPVSGTTIFADHIGDFSIVGLGFGPFEDGIALYYSTFPSTESSSELRAIVRVSGNRPPEVSATATPSFGPAPLQVTFDASGSTDPDNDDLTFEWQFGDGSAPGAGPTVVHTYLNAGTFMANVIVRDGTHEVTKPIRVDPGNTPPTPAILSPSPDLKFVVGQQIVLVGVAYDVEDGAVVPGANLTWRVLQHHNDHSHPYLPATTGASVVITAPPPEDLLAALTSYLEIQLTAVDSTGLARTITQEIRPRIVPITIGSFPNNLSLTVNETTVQTPVTIQSWAGWQLHLEANSQMHPDGSGRWLLADFWLHRQWPVGQPVEWTYVTPLNAEALPVVYRVAQNLAIGRPSAGSPALPGSTTPMALDGNAATMWKTADGTAHWFLLDLGAVHQVERVLLRWGAEFSQRYSIWAWTTGGGWALVHATVTGDGGVDDITGVASNARLLGLVVESPPAGVELGELEAYGRALPGVASRTPTSSLLSAPLLEQLRRKP